jgi:hypothetical protein
MGYDQHLMPFGHLGESGADLSANLTANPLVHLIEHQRSDGVVLHQHNLERQHEAGELTP